MGEFEGKCGCKGIRSCLICEQLQNALEDEDVPPTKQVLNKHERNCKRKVASFLAVLVISVVEQLGSKTCFFPLGLGAIISF